MRALRSARRDEFIPGDQRIRDVEKSLRQGYTSCNAGRRILRYGLPERADQRGKDLPPIRKTGNDRHRRVRRCGSHAFLPCNGDRHDKISCGDRLQLKRFHHETRDLYWKGGACGRKSGRWCKCIKCSQSRNDRNQLPARDIPR